MLLLCPGCGQEEDTQKADTQREGRVTPLAIRDTHTGATMTCHRTPMQTTKIEITDDPRHWWGVRQLGRMHLSGRDTKWCRHLEMFGQFCVR